MVHNSPIPQQCPNQNWSLWGIVVGFANFIQHIITLSRPIIFLLLSRAQFFDSTHNSHKLLPTVMPCYSVSRTKCLGPKGMLAECKSFYLTTNLFVATIRLGRKGKVVNFTAMTSSRKTPTVFRCFNNCTKNMEDIVDSSPCANFRAIVYCLHFNRALCCWMQWNSFR